jgi:hypothetical protein
MDYRHPDSQDASGDIHVGLDYSSPCWSDEIHGLPAMIDSFQRSIFERGHEAQRLEYQS